jgi:multidrug efflux pump subunit AcrA (membrane-fusion protein)
MPGGFANVSLTLQYDRVPLNIPSSALIFDQSGLRVAVVGPDDRVVLKTVTIGRDLGRTIQLASGLSPDDRVITAPPDGVADGDQVRVVNTVKPAGRPSTVSVTQDVKG